MVTRNADHLGDALGRLLEQFKDKADLAALLGTWVAEVQEIEDALVDIGEQRGLDTTVAGQVLDDLGTLLGRERNGRLDEPYRARLRAQVAVNVSSGTTEDVIAGLLAQEQVPQVINEGHAAFRVELADPPAGDDEVDAIVELVAATKAAGVRVLLTYPDGDGPFLSFGPAADIGGDSAGLDVGAFVGAVEVEP